PAVGTLAAAVTFVNATLRVVADATRAPLTCTSVFGAAGGSHTRTASVVLSVGVPAGTVAVCSCTVSAAPKATGVKLKDRMSIARVSVKTLSICMTGSLAKHHGEGHATRGSPIEPPFCLDAEFLEG